MSAVQLKLFYDGKCPFCTAEMGRLARWDHGGRLAFVDMAQPDFDCTPLGVDMAALDREVHGRTRDGRILVGIDCIFAAYSLVGRRWLVWPLRVPGLRALLATLYRGFARNRYAFSRWLGYGTAQQCESGVCAAYRAHTASDTAQHDDPTRNRVALWLYAVALAHLFGGIVLAWFAGSAGLDGYHRGIEAYFWHGAAPVAARAQQAWWMQLFGATLQCTAIWMLALVHIGYRSRQRMAWGALLAGLLIWAPQDIVISLQAGVWSHLAADGFALLAMVPPLLWLWRRDSR